MPWSIGLQGWPAAIASVVAFAAAFITTKRWPGVAGALLAAPFCLVVSSYPFFSWIGRIALAANLLAAYLLYMRKKDVAFAALAPFLVILTVLATFALRGITLVPRPSASERTQYLWGGPFRSTRRG